MAQAVERKEPANLEAEMNALGCGFISKTALTKLCDDLTPDMFSFGSAVKVWWKCKKGHSWKSSICTRTKGRKCPFCSKGVKTEAIFLIKSSVAFALVQTFIAFLAINFSSDSFSLL